MKNNRAPEKETYKVIIENIISRYADVSVIKINNKNSFYPRLAMESVDARESMIDSKSLIPQRFEFLTNSHDAAMALLILRESH